MGLHEDDKLGRLSDPFDYMYHDGIEQWGLAVGLIAVLTIIAFHIVPPDEYPGPAILAVGGTLAIGAFILMRNWMKAK